MTLEQAEEKAAADRIELKEVEKKIEESNKGVRLATAKLLPRLNLTGSYAHNQGSQFTQKDAVYVGAFANWDAWDWGTTTNGISAAKAKMRQAIIAREKIEHAVRLEARQAYVNVSTAAEAIVVAHAAVAHAEDNYRLVSKRYDANAATSFDVIDAEALLTQARAEGETSTYDYLIARAALARAIGEAPSGEAPR
jgi:outer membrane protein TolC